MVRQSARAAAAGTRLIRRQVADKPAAIADLHPAAMKTAHDTMGRSRLHRAFTLTSRIVREQRDLHRAVKRMPRPVPWAWAEPRLLPLLAGPYIDPPDMALVRTEVDPGCAVVIGLDLGGVFTNVDTAVAERWECSTGQLLDAAMTNLRQRTAAIAPTAVVQASFSGRIARLLRLPGGWASSVLLVQEDLVRLFGSHDQLFAAPDRSTLLNFPIDIDGSVAGHILIDFEMGATYPLMLDPFSLLDGVLQYQPAFEDE